MHASQVSNPEDVLAANVAHTMVFEDAAWAADIVYSASRDTDRRLAGLLPTLLIGHWARIIYEGSQTLRLTNPTAADLFEEKHASVLARARHSTKLFDDTKKSYEDVLADIATHHETHRARFTGNTVWFARWLETDLGLTLLGKRVVGTTITAHIHLGQPADAIMDKQEMGRAVLAASTEQGVALGVLLSLGGRLEPQPPLDLSELRSMDTVDHDTGRYLAHRFDDRFPTALKLLLLGVEADLSTCCHVFPTLEPGHQDPVFRARVVTVFHALRALQEIADKYTGPTLASIIEHPSVQRLSTKNAKRVRNHCVHYGVHKSVAGKLRPGQRMHGIVEAITGRTFEEFDDDIAVSTELAARTLRSWSA